MHLCIYDNVIPTFKIEDRGRVRVPFLRNIKGNALYRYKTLEIFWGKFHKYRLTNTPNEFG